MGPRARVNAVAAAAAVLVVAAIVGVTLLQTRGSETTAPGAVAKPRPGIPILLFDFGVRDDAEARDLARGAALLKRGKRAQAEALFARHPGSLQAKIGEAFAHWPDLDAVERLAAAHPDSPVAQLHFGLALLWSGRNTDAARTLQAVDTRFPDTRSAVDAEDLLYGNRTIPGLPYIIVPVGLPRAATLRAQLARAEVLSRTAGMRGKLVYGLMLWQLDRRISAQRQLDAAAKLAPGDPAVLTADAVSHFTKRNPAAAFGRLGPLSGRFPRAAVVRLHLGVLLLWTGQVEKGTRQLRLAVDEQPRSVYADQAKKLISALVPNGTK
jgi:hypothetical protein